MYTIALLLSFLEPSRLSKLSFVCHSAPPSLRRSFIILKLFRLKHFHTHCISAYRCLSSRKFWLRVTNNMTSGENIPVEAIASKKNTLASDAGHEDEISVSDEAGLPRLMGPLAIRPGNTSCPPPIDVHRSAEFKGSQDETISNPQDNKLNCDGLKQNNQSERSDGARSDVDSSDDDINDGQDDDEEYDFDYEDDDVPLDDDPFFGVAETKVAPTQPTEEQMETIRKTMEEDEKAAKAALEEALSQQAIQKMLTEDIEPPVLVSNNAASGDDAPDLIEVPHPLLNDQNYNATDMLISIRSSFGGDVYHIVGMTEPLLEMKKKFVQAVNLNPSELGTLEFLCGYHVIQDDDTVEKV